MKVFYRFPDMPIEFKVEKELYKGTDASIICMISHKDIMQKIIQFFKENDYAPKYEFVIENNQYDDVLMSGVKIHMPDELALLFKFHDFSL